MRFLVTGVNGTVAPVVVRRLEAGGHETVAWDRSRVSPDDREAVRRFVAETAPDWIIHAAMGAPEWAASLAESCETGPSRMLYVSSSSVFSGSGAGPYRPDADTDASDDYGLYKIACERAVAAAHPRALIVRIGWQIGSAPGGNNMLTWLADNQAREGAVRASTRWYPACSFLDDTAEAFVDLISRSAEGVWHVDANPGLTMFEIASRLNVLHGRPWTIVPAEDPVLDTRLADDRVAIAAITERLPAVACDS